MKVGNVGGLTERVQTNDVIAGDTTIVDALELRYSNDRMDRTLKVNELVEDVAAVILEGTKSDSFNCRRMLTFFSAGSDTVRVMISGGGCTVDTIRLRYLSDLFDGGRCHLGFVAVP